MSLKLPHVQIMSRSQCCLCDDAKAVVSKLAEQQGTYTWEEVNIDGDTDLMRRYGMDVPVLLIDGVVSFKHRVTVSGLTRALHEAHVQRQSSAASVGDMA
ncbi:MAG: glutaredoxin family protein [Mariprofundaceae bacterium]